MNIFKWLLDKFKAQQHPPEYYIIPELNEYCTLFGSRLWGGYKLLSDVDFVISKCKLQTVLNILDDLGIKHEVITGRYSFSEALVTFKYKRMTYNLTIVENKDYYSNHIVGIPVVTAYFKEYPYKARKKDNRIKVFSCVLSYISDPKGIIDSSVHKFIVKNYPELQM